MTPPGRPEWAMDVVLVCHVTPPADVLQRTVNEVCGSDGQIRSDNDRPLITVEADAANEAEAVEALQAKAQRLVDRLSDFGCAIELTSRLENRSVDIYPPEAPSLGEGA